MNVETRGFTIKADLLSISILAVCIVAIAVMILGRKPPQVVVNPCQAPAPVINIAAAAPVVKVHPRVIVKIIPDEFAPDPNVDNPPPQPQEQKDPVFEHRTPIITDALRTPLTAQK